MQGKFITGAGEVGINLGGGQGVDLRCKNFHSSESTGSPWEIHQGEIEGRGL